MEIKQLSQRTHWKQTKENLKGSSFQLWKNFLFAVFILAIPCFINAQTVHVGSGNSEHYGIPLDNMKNYNLSQSIYTTQELRDSGASKGYITKIRYKSTSDMSTEKWQDWVIYMGHTEKDGFHLNEKFSISGDMIKVFDGKIAAEVVKNEWMEIILETAFEWNGMGNIIVTVDENTPGKSLYLARWESYTVVPAVGLRRGGEYASDIINPDPSRPIQMSRTNVIPQIQFHFEPLCSGMPDAGQVPAVITSCPPFNLISTGATTHAGVLGQWESSPAGTNNWAPVTGAIYPTSYAQVPPKVATDYRYRVTCKTSGQTDVSGIIETVVKPMSECYCTHINEEYLAFSTINYFITSGALQNINITELEEAVKFMYTDYTDHIISQIAGDSVTFYTYLPRGFKFSVWVDWNQDGDFTDEGELMYYGGLSSNGILSTSFKVPENALPGLTRMRIAKQSGGQFSDPCDFKNPHEDFTFEVVPRTACTGKPNAGTVADHLLVLRGDAFTLATKGQSAGVGYGLEGQWEFKTAGEPDWFPIEGATGAAFEIRVAPSKATSYRYILTCSNSGLSDTSNISSFTKAGIEYKPYNLNDGSTRDYIKHFSTSGGVQNISNETKYDGNGYFLDQVVSQKMGHLIRFQGYTTRTSNGLSSVYVDWNQDGEFEFETYSAKEKIGDTIYRGSFYVPHYALPGKTRLRVVFYRNVSAHLESEDYTFEVLPNLCSDITFPASANAVSATSKVYGKGNISLNISAAFPIARGLTFQWQSSTDGQSWSNSGPAQSVAAKKMTNVTETTQYRVLVYCNGNKQLTSKPVTITVEAVEEILTTTGGERCTPGTVILKAYGESGTTVNWYDSPASSTPVFTGNIFETPALSASKIYYASVAMSTSDIISKKNVGQGNFSSNAIRKGKGSGFNGSNYRGRTPFLTKWISKNQYLIRADELQEAGIKPGNIYSIGFEVTLETGVVYPNFSISMKQTDKEAFVAGRPGRLDSNLTTVYTGDIKLHVGENTFPFHTPFYWDGTSNLIISLCNGEKINGHHGAGADIKYDNVSFFASQSPNTSWEVTDCGVTSEYVSTRDVTRPKMIFEAMAQPENPRVPVLANLDAVDAFATANSGQSKTQEPNVVHEYVNDNCEKLADILSTSNLGMVDVQVYMGDIPTTSDGIPFVGRFFTITPTRNFTAPSVITLYYSESDIIAYNDHVRNMNDPGFGPIDLQNPLSIRVYGYHGNINVGGAGPNGFDTTDVMVFNPTEVVLKDGNVAITFTTLGFSGFYINGLMQAPLAISMGDIKAENKGNVNVVTWNTHMEENGDRFEIERSVNGNQFEVIGRLAANGQPSDYSFIDENPINGFNYYRLGMIHRDGSHKTYSKVVIAQKAASAMFRLDAYPNPVTEKVTIKIEGLIRPNALIQVIDISGKVVKTVKVTKPEVTVPLTNLGSGMYLFKYIDDERSSTLKVLKK